MCFDPDRINNQQIKMIHTLKGTLKLRPQDYMDYLQQIDALADTCKDLNFDEAGELIRIMTAKAVEKGVWHDNQSQGLKYKDLANRPGMASPKQLRMVEAMWGDVTRAKTYKEKRTALRSFLKNKFKVEDLRFLTTKNIRRVIKTLQTMKENPPKEGKEGGQN